MANLTLRRWIPFAPDVGDNLALPEAEQLKLEIATALTSEQLKTLLASVSESKWGKLTELAPAFEPYVRVQAGHSIDGKPLASVADYFAAVCDVSSGGAAAIYAELTRQVVRLNSVEGELELFSQRRSGGSASTVAPSAAAKGSATAGP